jgi:hypothetical protein
MQGGKFLVASGRMATVGGNGRIVCTGPPTATTFTAPALNASFFGALTTIPTADGPYRIDLTIPSFQTASGTGQLMWALENNTNGISVEAQTGVLNLPQGIDGAFEFLIRVVGEGGESATQIVTVQCQG